MQFTNFGNISSNNIAITRKVIDLVSLGWEFDKILTGIQSRMTIPARGSLSAGIFSSRRLNDFPT
ncbi:MAG: hypothetical protein WCR01_01395 [Bacteroidota bacterium]